MKCIIHAGADAAATCTRCGSGICRECVKSSFYLINHKPLCKKCNYTVSLENKRSFRSALIQKMIKLLVFSVTFGIGLTGYINDKRGGAHLHSEVAIIQMLLWWGVGFIANIFDRKQDSGSKSVTVLVDWTGMASIGIFLGYILNFFIMAVSSPIQIVILLFRIIKLKKQITRNNRAVELLKSQM